MSELTSLLAVWLLLALSAVDGHWPTCRADADCPPLTNGRLDICVGRRQVLIDGRFGPGVCADSRIRGDCATDVDCALLTRKAGSRCVQTPGRPGGFRHCAQPAVNGWAICTSDADCRRKSSGGVDGLCLNRRRVDGPGECFRTGSELCKTNPDCGHRLGNNNGGFVCGRTPTGGRVCYHAGCTSPILCPTAGR